MKQASALSLFLALLLVGFSPYPCLATPDLSRFEKIVLPGRGVGYSAPIIAEIDGDIRNGKEIAFAGADAQLYVYTSSGRLLWKVKLPSADCTATTDLDKAYSSPSVGALYGDGVPYVVIGYGGFRSDKCDGGVAAYRGADGNNSWTFSIKSFSAQEDFFAYRNSVISTPALADVDGDGKLEVGFGAFDRNIYLLNADGTVRWYYHAADTVWSSPSFFNIDTDPNLEMIIGADISRNPHFKPATKDGGFVYAFKTSPVRGKFVPFRDPEKQITRWQKYFPQVVYSSPAIGEILSTHPGEEMVIGSGCYFPEHTAKKRGNEFRIMDPQTGKILAKLRTPLCSASVPALGDINGDGQPDVVVSIDSEQQWAGNGKGLVIAYNPATKAKMWQANLRALFPFQSPLIADLDRDGNNEVIMAESISLVILNGKNGATIARYRLPGSSRSTPAIDDLDNDGSLDIVATGGSGGKGELYIWRNVSGASNDELRAPAANALVWPQWRGSPNRTGIK